MRELTLPYHKKLPQWFGYKGGAEGIAVWWLGDRLAISDGWVTSNEGHTSSMRLMECTPRFQSVLSKFDYGHNLTCSWAVNKEHDIDCILFLNDKNRMFVAPQPDAVKMLKVYNQHKANRLDKECPSIHSKLKRVQRWGMKDDSIAENVNAVKQSTIAKPSIDEFEEYSKWLKQHNVRLSVPRAIK